MNNTLRAAQGHEVMSVIERAKPKPTKASRPKLPKKPSSAKMRKMLCKHLEAIVKEIIFWRDAQVCVQTATDGHRCGNGLMWGHYIAQKQSSWLRYELGNVFVQCGNHNQLDFRGDKSYAVWFMTTFGPASAQAMENERDAHRGGKQRSIIELEELLSKYDELLQSRFTVSADIPSLVEAGYFGEIIQGITIPERMATWNILKPCQSLEFLP